jgi:uncharacterized phage protein (TIGR01671 family)
MNKNQQRQIKFRVWDNLNLGKTYKFSHFNLNDALNWLRSGDVFQTSRDGIVQQFTGLTDKNGKETYEGDIVESNYGGTGQIVFLRGMYYCWNRKLTWEQFIKEDVETYEECATFLSGDENSQSNFTIIGNIFENPELLKA